MRGPKRARQTRLTMESDFQLNQRLKTAKRQMDEAEEEIERLEHTKKKLQRELDEQLEANEQLHGQLSALRSEIRSHATSGGFIWTPQLRVQV